MDETRKSRIVYLFNHDHGTRLGYMLITVIATTAVMTFCEAYLRIHRSVLMIVAVPFMAAIYAFQIWMYSRRTQ